MLPGWSRVEIAGKPAVVFDAAIAPNLYGVLWLHPVGGELPSDNHSFTAAFSRHGLFVCAPWGGESWWSDRISPDFDPVLTAEHYLMDIVLPWMQSRWNLGPRAVAVAGISMGGQGAIRLGFKHPETFGVVASISGAFDYHDRYGRGTTLDVMYTSREACRQDTAILWVHPTRVPQHLWFVCDPADEEWYPGNDRLREKLRATGVAHQADLETTGGGHSWDYFDRMAEPMATWIAESLVKESRRLI